MIFITFNILVVGFVSKNGLWPCENSLQIKIRSNMLKLSKSKINKVKSGTDAPRPSFLLVSVKGIVKSQTISCLRVLRLIIEVSTILFVISKYRYNSKGSIFETN